MAVGADSLSAPRYLRAVIDLAVRGLPHAFREAKAEAGGTRLSDDTAWKVLFHALPAADATRLTQIERRADLGQPLLHARSIVM